MQFVNIWWVGLLAIPQAIALDICFGQEFGYKDSDPIDSHAYYLCLGILGKIRNDCAEGFRFDVQEQNCMQNNLPSPQNDAKRAKSELNISQNITLHKPIILNIFGFFWNRPSSQPLLLPTTPINESFTKRSHKSVTQMLPHQSFLKFPINSQNSKALFSSNAMLGSTQSPILKSLKERINKPLEVNKSFIESSTSMNLLTSVAKSPSNNSSEGINVKLNTSSEQPKENNSVGTGVPASFPSSDSTFENSNESSSAVTEAQSEISTESSTFSFESSNLLLRPSSENPNTNNLLVTESQSKRSKSAIATNYASNSSSDWTSENPNIRSSAETEYTSDSSSDKIKLSTEASFPSSDSTFENSNESSSAVTEAQSDISTENSTFSLESSNLLLRPSSENPSAKYLLVTESQSESSTKSVISTDDSSYWTSEISDMTSSAETESTSDSSSEKDKLGTEVSFSSSDPTFENSNESSSAVTAAQSEISTESSIMRFESFTESVSVTSASKYYSSDWTENSNKKRLVVTESISLGFTESSYQKLPIHSNFLAKKHQKKFENSYTQPTAIEANIRERQHFICSLLPKGAILRNPKSCKKFYLCLNGRAVSRTCPYNLYFDIEKRACDILSLVKCFKNQGPELITDYIIDVELSSSAVNIDSLTYNLPSRTKNEPGDFKTNIFPSLYETTDNSDILSKTSTPLHFEYSSKQANNIEQNSPRLYITSRKPSLAPFVSEVSLKYSQMRMSADMAKTSLDEVFTTPYPTTNTFSTAIILKYQKAASSEKLSSNLYKRKSGIRNSVLSSVRHVNLLESLHSNDTSDCRILPNGAYLRDVRSCNKFYICANGRPISRSCPKNLYFDFKKLICNFPSLVECLRDGDKFNNVLINHINVVTKVKNLAFKNIKIATSKSKSLQESKFNTVKQANIQIGESKIKNNKKMSKNSILSDSTKVHQSILLVPTMTSDGSECSSLPNGAYLRDFNACDKFYICANGRAIPRQCPGALYFDIKKKVCNYASLVDCQDNIKSSYSKIKPLVQSTKGSYFIPDCNSLPNGTYLRDFKSCSKFYVCSNDRAVLRECPRGLHIDIDSKLCIFPSHVKCSITNSQASSRFIVLSDLSSSVEGHPECKNLKDGTRIRDLKQCNKYYICFNEIPIMHYCPPGKWFDLNRHACDHKRVVECNN